MKSTKKPLKSRRLGKVRTLGLSQNHNETLARNS